MNKFEIRNAAIITLYDSKNFGNRLQNYAVQTYFEKQGLKVETIPYQEKTKLHSFFVDVAFQIVHFLLKPTAYEKKRREILHKKIIRCAYIDTFNDQYIHTAPMLRYHNIPHNLASCHKYFIVGSDQVWHCWQNNRYELEYFLLMFADPSQRLTIAPSFGFNEFPKKYLGTYKKGLEGFEYLSVREERGAELIKKLTGKEATVLSDPTMLIDISEWLKILRRPLQYVDDNYIFIYVLGGFKGGVKEKTCKLADDLGLQVINIMNINSDYYIHTRPDEFLYWIHNAKLIVTDSFHASVFSILFNKPFVVTERSDIKGMEDRFSTLFHKFEITDRYFDGLKDGFEDEGDARNRLFAIDYSGVPAVLESERKKADEFYKKCFHED